MTGWIGRLLITTALGQQAATPLPSTEAMTATGDLSAQMVAGIHQYLQRRLDEAPAARSAAWKADRSSVDAYAKAIEPKRARLRRLLGAVDARTPTPGMELAATIESPARIAEGPGFDVLAVRWPALEGVHEIGRAHV